MKFHFIIITFLFDGIIALGMSLSRPYSIDGDKSIRPLLDLHDILIGQRQRASGQKFQKLPTATSSNLESSSLTFPSTESVTKKI